ALVTASEKQTIRRRCEKLSTKVGKKDKTNTMRLWRSAHVLLFVLAQTVPGLTPLVHYLTETRYQNARDGVPYRPIPRGKPSSAMPSY
ncbi:MAG: hypothetical protein ACYDBB_15500, partial [Armatimonadota bacterium]